VPPIWSTIRSNTSPISKPSGVLYIICTLFLGVPGALGPKILHYFIIHGCISNDQIDYNTLLPVIEKHKAAFSSYPKEKKGQNRYYLTAPFQS